MSLLSCLGQTHISLCTVMTTTPVAVMYKPECHLDYGDCHRYFFWKHHYSGVLEAHPQQPVFPLRSSSDPKNHTHAEVSYLFPFETLS